jgi:LacI family gluconate utilization system Gnt-I transcriptional repressor
LLSRRPDALLLTGVDRPPEVARMLADSAIPVVEIWDMAEAPTDMLVGFDHAEVGVAVARMFAAKGHDRFVTVSATDARAQARTTGFRDQVLADGHTLLPGIDAPAPSTIMAGRDAVRRLLPHLDRRMAMCCSSDLLAFGAVTEARIQGVAVPDQLAICGFGNFELGSASEPPISTVNVEGGRIGRTAASFLLDRLGGQDGSRKTHVPFHIVERATS